LEGTPGAVGFLAAHGAGPPYRTAEFDDDMAQRRKPRMRSRRKRDEELANELDLDLFELLQKVKQEGKAWEEVAADIRKLRAKVRTRMHEADLKSTQGSESA